MPSESDGESIEDSNDSTRRRDRRRRHQVSRASLRQPTSSVSSSAFVDPHSRFSPLIARRNLDRSSLHVSEAAAQQQLRAVDDQTGSDDSAFQAF